MTVRRIFIAVDISDAARLACGTHIQILRKSFPDVRVGWERAEKIHITLKFLGATDDANLENLKAGLEKIVQSCDRFSLRLSGPGIFPSKARPRILWIGVEDPTESLVRIQPAVERLCQTLGFEKDDRTYRPHLSIGRIREPQNAARLAEQHLQTNIEPVKFEVGDLVIYESKLQPTGSVYYVRARLGLKG